jgi:hypothetical protein
MVLSLRGHSRDRLAAVGKNLMYARIKPSHPQHVHVIVAKVVREGKSVRHHHVASLGKVKHSGRHSDGRYKFALDVRKELWQWFDELLASQRFDPAVAADFRDAVARKIPKP